MRLAPNRDRQMHAIRRRYAGPIRRGAEATHLIRPGSRGDPVRCHGLPKKGTRWFGRASQKTAVQRPLIRAMMSDVDTACVYGNNTNRCVARIAP
jgi:hypothetical protein